MNEPVINWEAVKTVREFLPALEKFTKWYVEFLGVGGDVREMVKLAFIANLKEIRKSHPGVEGVETYTLQLATLCTFEFLHDRLKEALTLMEREETAKHGVN